MAKKSKPFKPSQPFFDGISSFFAQGNFVLFVSFVSFVFKISRWVIEDVRNSALEELRKQVSLM
ncbi:MAG TPA: hypothetical protein V6C58_11380 [Allocoleopsis sp.]